MTFTHLPFPRGDDKDVFAGISLPDPFRALEDDLDPAVMTWQAAQSELADAYVAGVPGVEQLRARVAYHTVERIGSVPRFAGGRWFWTEHAQGAAQAGVVAADEPAGEGTVVFDPVDHVDDHGRVPLVSWLSPSPDGRLLAVGLCYDGSETNTIRLADVESGRPLPDRPPQLLMDNWMGGAQWLPDSCGFFYVALHGPLEDFTLRVFRHDIGEPARSEPETLPLADGPGEAYVGVFVSRDGRWALASQNLTRPRPVAVLDLTDRGSDWRPFVTDLDAAFAGHVVGDAYVAVTDHDAPRGRLVAIPMAGAANEPANWRVVVPEGDAVLRTVTPVGDLLYVNELVESYARVRIIDQVGTEVGQIPLPGRGALAAPSFPLMTMVPRGHPDEYVFGFSSLTQSWGAYRHRPGDDTVETIKEPEARLDAVVEDHWATSRDGTRVPYHIVRARQLPSSVPMPALVYGYGGFNVPLLPQFPRSAMGAFVEAGGLFVHAHLRGGGEFGLHWWQGGRMANKQNCYDDLYAVAEDLIERGCAAADRLAVAGGSNGGLMAGVAITQRPDLWRAAVPHVPLLDLLGACRERYGRAAVTEELGNPDDPDEVTRLASISPYHLVKDGTAYPAVYLDVGDTDPRCPPWHGRKFAARLQEATAGDRPVFLRVWENVGHGWATAKDAAVRQNTAWLAFVIDQLGMSGCPIGNGNRKDRKRF